MNSIFETYAPSTKPIGLLSIPHGGEWIPEDFQEFLTADIRACLEDVDFKTHELVDKERLCQEGLFVIVSKVSRVAVDLNRSRDKSVLWWEQNTQGAALLQKVPSLAIRKELTQKYYDPYYTQLKQVIQAAPRSFPIIDLHSMPSWPTAYHLKRNPNQPPERPDFCLSDNFAKTCAPEYTQYLTDLLSSKNFQVQQNDPYMGGHLTSFMGSLPTNTMQVEIKRKLYMDEKKKCLKQPEANQLKYVLTEALSQLFKKFTVQ